MDTHSFLSKLLIFLSFVLFLGFFAVLGYGFIWNKQKNTEEALLSGQRVELSLSTPKEETEYDKEYTPASLQPAKKILSNDPSLALVMPEKPFSSPAASISSPPPSTQEANADIASFLKEVPSIQRNYYPFPDKPAIAIIVKGLGLNTAATEAAFELSPLFTLGFSPYAHHISYWSSRAQAGKFETVLHLPMETSLTVKEGTTGQYALNSTLSPAENTQHLKGLLTLIQDYAGVYTEAEERFTTHSTYIPTLLSLLQSANVPLLYGNSADTHTFFSGQAKLAHIPFLINNLTIANTLNPPVILEKLAALEDIARNKGYAIAMIESSPAILDTLKKWEQTTAAKGIQLVPVSALIQKHMAENSQPGAEATSAGTPSATSGPRQQPGTGIPAVLPLPSPSSPPSPHTSTHIEPTPHD